MSKLSGWAKLKHLPASDPRRIRHREYARDYLAKKGGRKRTPEEAKLHSRKQNLRRNFGLTPEEYERMNEAQGGLCAICLRPDRTNTGKPRRLAVDHNHETLEIRGLLCKNCNVGLGVFQDDPLRLSAAVAYLRGCFET